MGIIVGKVKKELYPSKAKIKRNFNKLPLGSYFTLKP